MPNLHKADCSCLAQSTQKPRCLDFLDTTHRDRPVKRTKRKWRNRNWDEYQKPSRSHQALNLPKSSNTATASTGSSSSTIKSQILKCTFKTLCFFLKKKKNTLELWLFSWRHWTGHVLGQIFGKFLSNFSCTFAQVRARQLSGEKVVSKPASYYFSLQQNFSLGDLHNKLGFRNYFYFCVSKNNRIKN